LQDVGDAFLFRDLKTCNGLRTAAAALARPLELADVDVQVIPVSSSFLFFRKQTRVQHRTFAR